MNNTQLYLSIGIPSFLVILAWLSNRADIQKMGDRLDKGQDQMRQEMIALRREMQADITKGLDNVRGEMVAMRREMQSDISKGLDGVRGEMVAFRREMHSDMVPLHERIAVVETRIENK